MTSPARLVKTSLPDDADAPPLSTVDTEYLDRLAAIVGVSRTKREAARADLLAEARTASAYMLAEVIDNFRRAEAAYDADARAFFAAWQSVRRVR